MIISSRKRKIVYNKTSHRCAMCGVDNNTLTCVGFIPTWTRIVADDVENMIPLCDECRIKRGYNFIEIGMLRFLPGLYVDQLLRHYWSLRQYLRKYVRLYGASRTGGSIDIDKTLLIMKSYDYYIWEKDEDIHWEEL